MKESDYLNPNDIKSQCDQAINKLENDNETLNIVSKSVTAFSTDNEIKSVSFENLKQQLADYITVIDAIKSANAYDIAEFSTLKDLVGDEVLDGANIRSQMKKALDNKEFYLEKADEYEMKKETFRIDAPRMPNGGPESTLHMAITDETGNTAVLEYLDGKLSIHEGKEYQVMTNSPRYEYQLAINDYWKEVGGLQMLPGTNRSSDRFVRASFYIHAIPQTADAKIAVPSVLSVMRNVSVPFGINTPEKPHISSTRWRSVSDQKNKVYYFESTLTPNLFWLDLKKIDFSPKAGIKKLSLTKGEIYAGDAVKDLKDSESFTFLFETPLM